ncbi:MAG: LuxR C-terminal-related transcriptional regulator [Chloroflexota bacterium]
MSQARPPLPVLVIAGSPALRAGIAALLEEDGGIAPMANPRPGTAPAAIVVDVASAGGSVAGVEAEWPDAPLVLLGGSPGFDGPADPGTPVAWLPAEAEAEALAAAVRAVAAGLTVIDPGRAAAIRPHAAAGAVTGGLPGESLTAREREVLALVADGLPNKAIARELGISEHTAKFHVGSVLGKLGAGSRAEAVAIATRRGLLAV